MRDNYRKTMAEEIANKIKKEGLRVFLTERGTYGFYTNYTGSRIVSFQVDLTVSFSGNYKSKTNGTGWRIMDGLPDNFTALLNEPSPFSFDHYTTLDEHLKTYQQSSKYSEFTATEGA